MKDSEKRIKQAIIKPIFITQDAQYPKRQNYYKSNGRKGYIKVVVEFTDEDVGDVVTAFPTDNIKKSETEIWKQQKPKRLQEN